MDFPLKYSISLVVYGKPQPQGSTRAFIPKGWKRPVITTANAKLKPWRKLLSEAMMREHIAEIPRQIPVRVWLEFYFERPKSSKRVDMTVKPDLDKLQRAVFDALTDTMIDDDSQITHVEASKHYGTPERVEVRLEW